jgi:hypothetical protein
VGTEVGTARALGDGLFYCFLYSLTLYAEGCKGIP